MIHEKKAPSQGSGKDIGVCPYCGEVDGYYNYGPNHYFVCFKHEASWLGGYDLFSTWRQETTDDWINNRQRFEGYASVTPAADKRVRCGKVYNYLRAAPDTEWL